MSAQSPNSESDVDQLSVPNRNQNRETSDITGVVNKMDLTAAKTILEGGKPLKMAVDKFRAVRIQKQDDTFFFALKAPTEHTDTRTSLKKLTAAAGIFCADQNTSLEVGNSLADAHGLKRLAQTNPSLYYLYNIGLDYELQHETFYPMVLALMKWREKYAEKIFKRDIETINLREAPFVKKRFPNDEDYEVGLALAQPYIDILESHPYQSRREAFQQIVQTFITEIVDKHYGKGRVDNDGVNVD